MPSLAHWLPLSLALSLAFGLSVTTTARADEARPSNFVYLRDIAPSIVQEMRYYGSHNFVGRRIDGYRAPECILTKKAALALKRVQERLNRRGLSLKVYDCYRPKRAVRHFVNWAKRAQDRKTEQEFYPTIDKSRLFALKYISSRSEHSRGSTVDLTIVPIGSDPQSLDLPAGPLVPCHLPAAQRYKDNSLDMGTGYDCFHENSHTKSNRIPATARANRNILVDAMAAEGFRNYSREWWHFTLRNEPFRRTRFDFEITPRKSAEANPPKQRPAKSEAAPATTAPATPDAPSKRLRIVCKKPDDLLTLRKSMAKASQVVAQVPSDMRGLVELECNGSLSLRAWHALDAISKKLQPAPLCRIGVFFRAGSAVPDATGWASGRFLLGESAPDPKC